MASNVVEEFKAIAASFMALIDGLSYIDEDVAEKIADDFSDKLVKSTRTVFQEMAAKVSVELAKNKRGTPRRRKVASTVVPVSRSPEYEIDRGNGSGGGGPSMVAPEGYFTDEEMAPMGTDPLPPNPQSFIGGSGPMAAEDFNTGSYLSGGVVERERAPSSQPSRPVPQKRLPNP